MLGIMPCRVNRYLVSKVIYCSYLRCVRSIKSTFCISLHNTMMGITVAYVGMEGLAKCAQLRCSLLVGSNSRGVAGASSANRTRQPNISPHLLVGSSWRPSCGVHVSIGEGISRLSSAYCSRIFRISNLDSPGSASSFLPQQLEVFSSLNHSHG